MPSDNNASFPFAEVEATVVTTTKYVTATATSTLRGAATVKPSTGPALDALIPQQLRANIPHYPRVDLAFAAAFGLAFLLLLVGIILRKKSKKLKAFNIPLILGTFFDALGHLLHADIKFINGKYELGRVVRIILTLAPICYSLSLFCIHRKTRNRETVRSAMMFSCLAGIHVLYCLIAAFGDGAVLFYTGQKWGEMDVARHLAVSQVFGQQFMLCIMLGMWLRGRNIHQESGRSLSMEEILALVTIPTMLGALIVRVSAQFIVAIRNDQRLAVYDLLEASAEIHIASASALVLAAWVCVLCQGWLWRRERIACQRRDEERQQQGEQKWTPAPPLERYRS